MINVKITEEIKEACPCIALGLIQCDVKFNESSDDLLKEINDYCSVLEENLVLENLSKDEVIACGRDVYKKLGKSPSKYRLSSEALIRRILQGKGLYRVNNIVDINNLISIKSKLPVGSYDTSEIGDLITIEKALEGAKYKGIGKDLINIENLPILSDEKGPFGSPTSDSERAMVTENSKNIYMCIYGFSGEENLMKYLKSAKELLEKYDLAKNIEINIIK